MQARLSQFPREGLRWACARSQGQANRGRFGEEPVKKDHYSVLGVTPASEDVVIRAAYHALMRRYHPDADPTQEGAELSRAINEAYAVLRDRRSGLATTSLSD